MIIYTHMLLCSYFFLPVITLFLSPIVGVARAQAHGAKLISQALVSRAKAAAAMARNKANSQNKKLRFYNPKMPYKIDRKTNSVRKSRDVPQDHHLLKTNGKPTGGQGFFERNVFDDIVSQSLHLADQRTTQAEDLMENSHPKMVQSMNDEFVRELHIPSAEAINQPRSSDLFSHSDLSEYQRCEGDLDHLDQYSSHDNTQEIIHKMNEKIDKLRAFGLSSVEKLKEKKRKEMHVPLSPPMYTNYPSEYPEEMESYAELSNPDNGLSASETIRFDINPSMPNNQELEYTNNRADADPAVRRKPILSNSESFSIHPDNVALHTYGLRSLNQFNNPNMYGQLLGVPKPTNQQMLYTGDFFLSDMMENMAADKERFSRSTHSSKDLPEKIKDIDDTQLESSTEISHNVPSIYHEQNVEAEIKTDQQLTPNLEVNGPFYRIHGKFAPSKTGDENNLNIATTESALVVFSDQSLPFEQEGIQEERPNNIELPGIDTMIDDGRSPTTNDPNTFMSLNVPTPYQVEKKTADEHETVKELSTLRNSGLLLEDLELDDKKSQAYLETTSVSSSLTPNDAKVTEDTMTEQSTEVPKKVMNEFSSEDKTSETSITNETATTFDKIHNLNSSVESTSLVSTTLIAENASQQIETIQEGPQFTLDDRTTDNAIVRTSTVSPDEVSENRILGPVQVTSTSATSVNVFPTITEQNLPSSTLPANIHIELKNSTLEKIAEMIFDNFKAEIGELTQDEKLAFLAQEESLINDLIQEALKNQSVANNSQEMAHAFGKEGNSERPIDNANINHINETNEIITERNSSQGSTTTLKSEEDRNLDAEIEVPMEKIGNGSEIIVESNSQGSNQENMMQNNVNESINEDLTIIKSSAEDTTETASNTATNGVVSSPNLFDAPYFNTHEEYRRTSEDFDTIVGAQRDKIDNIQKQSTDDGDLLMISFIGDGILKDIEQRKNEADKKDPNSATIRIKKSIGLPKHEIIPITRLISDPSTKIDTTKTFDNIGAVVRTTFENSRAPMYHVRNMLGNTKNGILSAARIAPNNMLVPSKYTISKASASKLGSINENLLDSRSGMVNDNNDDLGITDTFEKIGGMVKESLDSSKDVLNHVNDAAIDARNALYTVRNSAPRLVVPAQSPLIASRSSSSVPNPSRKAVLIQPRLLDVQENMVQAQPEYPANFLGMGEILDAVGLTKPDQLDVEMDKIVLEPSSFDLMKQWGKPKELSSSSAVKNWVKDNLKCPQVSMSSRFGDVLSSTNDAEKKTNLKEFLNKMHQEMKEILTSQHEERKLKQIEKSNKKKKEREEKKNKKKADAQYKKKGTSPRKTIVQIEQPVQKKSFLEPRLSELVEEGTRLENQIVEMPTIKPVMEKVVKKQPADHENSTAEETTVGLYLLPDLMKPFMGQSTQDVRRMEENEDDSVSENLGNPMLPAGPERVGDAEIKRAPIPLIHKSSDQLAAEITFKDSPKPMLNQELESHSFHNKPNDDLGHVLGAVNPLMFEQYFNESLRTNKTKNNITENNSTVEPDERTRQPFENEKLNEISEVPDQNARTSLKIRNIYKKPFMGFGQPSSNDKIDEYDGSSGIDKEKFISKEYNNNMPEQVQLY